MSSIKVFTSTKRTELAKKSKLHANVATLGHEFENEHGRAPAEIVLGKQEQQSLNDWLTAQNSSLQLMSGSSKSVQPNAIAGIPCRAVEKESHLSVA